MKKILTLFLLFLTMTLISCSKNNNELYYIEDIVMKDSIFGDVSHHFESRGTIKEVEKFELVPNNIKAIKFDSIDYNDNKTEIFAYFGYPQTKAPKEGYPAMVLVHGGMGKAEYSWVEKWNERGYAAIAIDIFGNEDTKTQQRIENPLGGPGEEHHGSFWETNKEVDQTWVYQRVINIIHANNILRNDDKIDQNKIGLTGISWGGYLTLITAGIDKRFALFAPIYGAGFLYEDTTWLNRALAYLNESDLEQWILKFDPKTYAPYATKPIMFISGVDSKEPFSPLSRKKTYDLIPGKVFLSIRKDLTHSQEYGESLAEVHDFAEHIFYNKNKVLLIEDVSLNNNTASFTHQGNLMIKSIKLVYSDSSDTDAHKWIFKDINVDFSEERFLISADLPKDATMFFFQITDENRSISSTDIVFV